MNDLEQWPAEPVERQWLLAGVAQRIFAYIVDAFILVLVNVAINAAVYAAGFQAVRNRNGANEYDVPVFVTISILELLVAAAYFIYTWRTFQGSPGMRLLSIRLGDATTGAPLTFQQAALRWMLLFLPISLISIVLAPAGGVVGAIGSLLSLAYYAWLLVTTMNDPNRQGFHDRQAHDLVVVG